ncbi:hypothetical protein AB0L70_10080 [Kribbella sp. NPDC051952]|uniref:hypothetical protein n=1 Tax=Kribbella sp. NPDC051952 TaxID=3154851 RepID=UPI00344AEF2F
MIEDFPVQVYEDSDVPEPCVAFLEVRCPHPTLYDDPKPVTTLHLKPGFSLDALMGWMQMRLETLPSEADLESAGFTMFVDADEVVARTYVTWHDAVGAVAGPLPGF